MRRRWLGAATGVLVAAGLGGATRAHAQAGAVDLRVDCPALDDPTRALFEARARAELVAEARPAGNVTITCAGAEASIVWQPSAGPPESRSTALPAGDAAVDSLLAAVHDLLAQWTRDQAAAAVPPDAGAPPAPPVVIPVVAPPPVEPAAVPSPPAAPSPVAASAGIDAELWQGGVAAALGAHGAARVRLGGAWHASLLAGPLFGLGSADGASAWSLRAIARVDDEIVSHVVLDLGVDGRIVFARTPASGTQSAATAGLVLGARYAAPIGPFALSVGPSIEALARPIAVSVAGSEAFRVPTVLGGLSLEASYP